MGRSSGVEFQVSNTLDEAKLDTLSQIFINNPNCFTYEQFAIGYDETGGSVNSMVYPGLIDITKFFDSWHQNCLRYSEIWASIIPSSDSSLQLCGEVLPSLFGILPSVGVSCPSDETCISARCVKECVGGACGSGLFLTYEVSLKDVETGETYSFASFESLNKAQFSPSLYGGVGDWAGSNYDEYISCKSDYVQTIYIISQPVFIAYPRNTGLNEDPEKHAGIITINLCRGVYGKSTNTGNLVASLIGGALSFLT